MTMLFCQVHHPHIEEWMEGVRGVSCGQGVKVRGGGGGGAGSRNFRAQTSVPSQVPSLTMHLATHKTSFMIILTVMSVNDNDIITIR